MKRPTPEEIEEVARKREIAKEAARLIVFEGQAPAEITARVRELGAHRVFDLEVKAALRQRSYRDNRNGSRAPARDQNTHLMLNGKVVCGADTAPHIIPAGSIRHPVAWSLKLIAHRQRKLLGGRLLCGRCHRVLVEDIEAGWLSSNRPEDQQPRPTRTP